MGYGRTITTFNTKKDVRVIIAGGRDFNDITGLIRKCDKILQNIPPRKLTIISGTAKGADQIGEAYARMRKIHIERFPANWEKYGKKAGFIRNSKMADNADALIAFWDGKSSGTKMMINIAREKGLKVRVIKYGKRK